MKTEQLFITATKNKLRFSSTKGLLTTEDLWDLVLESKNGNNPDLNSVAKNIAREIKQFGDEDFVGTTTSDKTDELKLKLEIVKFVIETKKAEHAAKLLANKNAELKRIIAETINNKQNQALQEKSLEELQAMLNA